jgi:2'-5' RNA ligase
MAQGKPPAGTGERIKLFVAIPVPEETGKMLSGAVQPWLTPQVRPVPVANYHITLYYFGHVYEPEVERAKRALAKVDSSSFSVTLGGAGIFTGVAWAALQENPSLRGLQAAIANAVSEEGLPPLERPYTPHISLFRNKMIDASWLEKMEPLANGWRNLSFTVTQFILYESQFGPGHSVYVPLAAYSLK